MENIKELTAEELVKSYVQFQAEIETLDAGLRVVRDELLDRLKTARVDGIKVGSYLVKKSSRITFPDVKMSEARELGAVTEAIDQAKLKALYLKGVKVKAKVTVFVIVKDTSN